MKGSHPSEITAYFHHLSQGMGPEDRKRHTRAGMALHRAGYFSMNDLSALTPEEIGEIQDVGGSQQAVILHAQREYLEGRADLTWLEAFRKKKKEEEENRMPGVLLIDDNPDIQKANVKLFRSEGYNVTTASTGVEAVAALYAADYDCIVLDIQMPDMDGFVICKVARQVTNVPIIFLTCMDELGSKVKGVMSGGDEYLTKPYKLEELSAIVGARIKRSRQSGNGNADPAIVHIDHDTRIVRTPKRNTFLSQKEFDLFLVLYQNPGVTFSRAELLRQVWGDAGKDDNTVAVHIMRLRRKLREDERYIGRIDSAYREGYRLLPPGEDETP